MGISDGATASSVSGVYDGGGVPSPPTYGDARLVDESSPKLVAAGDTGDRCRSGDTTRPLQRRLQEECSVETDDPMTPMRDFINKLPTQPEPKSSWIDWPLPLENGPCDPDEAFVCCDTWFQEHDRTWTVTYCSAC